MSEPAAAAATPDPSKSWEPSGARGTGDGLPIPIRPAADPAASPAPAAAPPAAPVLGRGGTEIPPEAISERLERERRKWMREEYGTEDQAEVERLKASRRKEAEERLARDKEYEKLRTAEEKRRRDEMSELERYKADIKARDEELQRTREELNRTKTDVLAGQQDAVIDKVATAAKVNPKFTRYAKADLAAHFRSLPVAEQNAFDQRALDKWFGKYAKENPEFILADAAPETAAAAPAAAAPAKAPAVAAPPVRKVPVGTARPAPPPARPAARDTSPDMHNGKTVLPGRPNSMSKAELNEYMRSKGMRAL